ncbi:MAG: hypothetical protein DRN83_01350 [Hadesarchaea archaeon]|nr:MAG: hypothetical protein DRN83_01350 [Hadesarchaea archaeon]
MNEARIRTKPARRRKISEIKISDGRVRVIGLVVDKKETEFTLDDGTGHLTVIFDDPAEVGDLKVGSKVSIFGTPLSVSGSNELHAEIIQIVDELDLELYNKVINEAERLECEIRGEMRHAQG